MATIHINISVSTNMDFLRYPPQNIGTNIFSDCMIEDTILKEVPQNK
jgi:hypothetical protein